MLLSSASVAHPAPPAQCRRLSCVCRACRGRGVLGDLAILVSSCNCWKVRMGTTRVEEPDKLAVYLEETFLGPSSFPRS